MLLRKLAIHIEKKIDPCLAQHSTAFSRWNKDINLYSKTLKLLEGYIRVCFYEPGREKTFLNKTPKTSHEGLRHLTV